MQQLKCYYAHPMATYDSTIEESDIKLLNMLGLEVINPNSEEHKVECAAFVALYGKEMVMEYFEGIVCNCDVLAFRATPDGKILSDVATEIRLANNLELPIIELPRMLEERSLGYPETKKYLIESGFYKK